MQERIETARCILRKVSVDDAQAIFDSYAQNPEVTKFLTRKPHISIQDTYEFLQRCLTNWELDKEYNYAIIHTESQLFMGMFSFRYKETHVGSFGYALAQSFWSQGYMTEVLQTMISLGFSLCGFKKIIGYCDVENIGSAKVMENVGMRFMGIEKEYLSLPAFGVVKRDAKVYEIYPN